MDWLQWDGWDGVSGVAALVALVVALGLAVIEIRAWMLVPRGVGAAWMMRVEDARTNGGRKVVRFQFRVAGPKSLYEVEMFRTGHSEATMTVGAFAVLEASTGWVEVAADVDPDGVDDYRFVVTWVEHTRLGPIAGGIRVGSGEQEMWRRYRWPMWPRKSSGRWRPVRDRILGARGMIVPHGLNH